MNSAKIITLVILVLVSLVSGYADSQGFSHASLMWKGTRFVTDEFIKSFVGFSLGIVFYWIAVRFMQIEGIVTPEVQTLLWFVIVIVGIALTSGKFLHWQVTDQIVGVITFAGVTWLLVRVGS